MFSLPDKIIGLIANCNESLRLILTTAALVALIMGGIALHNFYGGLLTGFGVAVITLSLFGVIYEQYLEDRAETAKKEFKMAESAKNGVNNGETQEN